MKLSSKLIPGLHLTLDHTAAGAGKLSQLNYQRNLKNFVLIQLICVVCAERAAAGQQSDELGGGQHSSLFTGMRDTLQF